MVEVRQEDREAAASSLGWKSVQFLREIRAGDHDSTNLVQAFALHRIAAENASHQEITALRARIAELEARLEIDPAHPYDGIAARDATIEGLQGQIAELEADRAEWVEVERLRMGKV